MEDIFEKIRNAVSIRDVVTEFYEAPNDKNFVRCPFHDDHHPSLSIDDKRYHMWRCFTCGARGDAVAFVAKLHNERPIDAAMEIVERFHIRLDEGDKVTSGKASSSGHSGGSEKASNEVGKVVNAPCDIEPTRAKLEAIRDEANRAKAYIERCQKDISKTDYFEKRGLGRETIARFHLGYDASRKCVVIPYDRHLSYYQTRSVEGKEYKKMSTIVGEPVFGAEHAYDGTQYLFVVESPICAMSIEDCGGKAIATCGTTCNGKVVDLLTDAYFDGGVIVAMDNDEPGKMATKSLVEALKKAHIKVTDFNIAGKKKDPNELLMESREQLIARMKGAMRKVRRLYTDTKKSMSADQIMGLDIPPMTWIVDDFIPTGLSFLSGKSKIRKSWMVLQLGLAVANGRPFLDYESNKSGVLYYALEDTYQRLQSRIPKVMKKGDNLDNLYIALKADKVEGGLFEQIEAELDEHPNIKLVIIDTLQKVRCLNGKDRQMYANDYSELGVVKDFADDHDIAILFVHHNRKMRDDIDVVNEVSGSTGLQGVNDNIMVLTVNSRNDLYATMTRVGRDFKGEEFKLRFDEDTFSWEKMSADEVVEERNIASLYMKDVYMNTVKKLVAESDKHMWEGTVTDLKSEAEKHCGTMLPESPTSVGRLITRYKACLEADGIFERAHKSNIRTHLFYMKGANTLNA